MAKTCAECGEKLKLTNKHWQYINGVFTEFCSDEHRAAYEGRAALEAQSKPQPAIQSQQSAPKGPIGRWFQASAIGRWYHGRLNLGYTFWITFVSIPLLMGAVTSSATRSDANTIASYLGTNSGHVDIDGDGSTEALTDGLLLLRYLFGFDGATLIEGAVSASATRTTADEIKSYIQARIATGS